MNCPVCKSEAIIQTWTEDNDDNHNLCDEFYMNPIVGYSEEEIYVVICANCGVVYKPKEKK